jgi:spermidine synthase
VRAAVLLAFFLSGASSLLFESLWTRELTLIFGSTTLAISTVLATFMGGLGLGSWLVGRRADKFRDPLRAYALVEGGVGVYALIVPVILAAYPALARGLYHTLGDHYVALSLGRFVAAALLLGIPTTLMGATLPLLARHFIQQPWQMKRIGLRLGVLYAVNTFGALAGAFTAGFVLLPLYGVRATNYTGATINLALCAFVLSLRRRAQLTPEAEPLSAMGDTETTEAMPERAVRVTLIAFAVSGATAMTLEVLWTRALAVVMGSSIYSFTLILVAFLGGLAGGARLFGRTAARTKDPVAALAFLHMATAAAIGATYLLIDKLPRVFVWSLKGSSFDVDSILAWQFLLAMLAILTPTILMGGVFPLTMRIYAGGVERVGRDVGTAYAINTVGAILGSFLAGFVALPILGLQRGIAVAAGLDVVLAVALVAVAPHIETMRRRALLVGAPVAFAAAALILPRWNLVYFDYGLFRVDYVREILDAGGRWALPDLLYYKDGIATTVSVERFGKHTALKNNGKVDASNGDDMPTQIMVGLMPFYFTQAPHPSVAVVGYGSGVTAGATTQTPASRIDVVELEPAVVEGARFFTDVNHDPPHNPRVHIHIGDGRNFLAQTREQFDVVISEPSNPWITGVSNLFTAEYWHMAHARLKPGGVFCQWAQLYEMSPTHIKTILRTFASEFPYTYVFAAEDLSSDVVLVAADAPLKLERADFARRLADPTFGAESRRGGVRTPEDLVAYLLLAPDEIPAFTAGAPLNTDDNAIIEFGAPRDLLGYNSKDKYLARVYGEDWPYGRLENLLVGDWDAGLLAKALLAHGRVGAAMGFIRKGGASAAEARELAELLANDPPLPDDLDPPKLPATMAPAEQEKYARDYAQVEKLVRRRAWEEARTILSHWDADVADKAGPDFALLDAYILWHIPKQFMRANDVLSDIEDDDKYLERRPEALYLLGRVYYTRANFKEGIEFLERYRKAKPAH